MRKKHQNICFQTATCPQHSDKKCGKWGELGEDKRKVSLLLLNAWTHNTQARTIFIAITTGFAHRWLEWDNMLLHPMHLHFGSKVAVAYPRKKAAYTEDEISGHTPSSKLCLPPCTQHGNKTNKHSAQPAMLASRLQEAEWLENPCCLLQIFYVLNIGSLVPVDGLCIRWS